MQPVFLMVSSRLDDIYALLQDMMDYLQQTQHPLLHELRDGVNTIATDGVGAGSTDLLLYLVSMFLGILAGEILMRIFWQRMGK